MARKDEELNDDQRNIKIVYVNIDNYLKLIWSFLRQIPTILEYTSYNFSFINFLAGPSCSFHDYKQYITGDNVQLLDNPNAYAKVTDVSCTYIITSCHRPKNIAVNHHLLFK